MKLPIRSAALLAIGISEQHSPETQSRAFVTVPPAPTAASFHLSVDSAPVYHHVPREMTHFPVSLWNTAPQPIDDLPASTATPSPNDLAQYPYFREPFLTQVSVAPIPQETAAAATTAAISLFKVSDQTLPSPPALAPDTTLPTQSTVVSECIRVNLTYYGNAHDGDDRYGLDVTRNSTTVCSLFKNQTLSWFGRSKIFQDVSLNCSTPGVNVTLTRNNDTDPWDMPSDEYGLGFADELVSTYLEVLRSPWSAASFSGILVNGTTHKRYKGSYGCPDSPIY